MLTEEQIQVQSRPRSQAWTLIPVPNPRRDHLIGFLIFILAAAFFVGNCVAPVIFDDNEGLYAGAAKEMIARHDWLLPTNNGLPRIQKPPLVYWLILTAAKLLGGLSVFAIRLPNALFTAAWIYATYLIGLRLRDSTFGALGAIILASMVGVSIFNHLVQPEPFLATFISLTIFCFLSAHTQPTQAPRWFLWAWVFMALGAMSKGLHGALWPLGVVVITALLFPSTQHVFRRFFSWKGLALFALIVIPWYIALEIRLPHVLRDHFFNEQLGAALNTRYPNENTTVPLGMFYLQHLIFFLPWTLLVPAALYAWRKFGRAQFQHHWDLVRILMVWVGLTFVSLTFSNLQDYYAMTCWGALALALAWPWHPHARTPRLFFAIPCLLLLAGGLAGLVFGYFYSDVLTAAPATVAPIAHRDTFANALGGFSPGVWKDFIPLMRISAWALTLGAAAALFLTLRSVSRILPVCAIAVAVLIPLSLITPGFQIISPYFSLADSATAINALSKPGAIVACDCSPHHASSFFYYLNNRVHWVNARFDSNYAGRVLGEGRDLYYTTDTFLPVWSSSQQVFFVVEQEKLAEWQALLATTANPPRLLLESGSRAVLVNQ